MVNSIISLMSFVVFLLFVAVTSAINCYQSDNQWTTTKSSMSSPCMGDPNYNACAFGYDEGGSPWHIYDCWVIPPGQNVGCEVINGGHICTCKCNDCNANQASVDACRKNNSPAFAAQNIIVYMGAIAFLSYNSYLS